MAAIAKAMGLPPALWFDEGLGDGSPSARVSEEHGIAVRVEHLFDAVMNPKTGEPYTSAEVARMTLGDLSEEGVEGVNQRQEGSVHRTHWSVVRSGTCLSGAVKAARSVLQTNALSSAAPSPYPSFLGP
jgi:hypothetical protein